MRVDIENMLRQAGRAAGNRYGYFLGNLAKHLKEVRDRSIAGDAEAVLSEFFKLYVFDDGKDYEDLRNSQGKPE